MYTLFFMSLTIFVVYLAVSLMSFGIPTSLSETYYHWEEKGRDLGILFTSFIWGMTFPLMIVWIDVLPNDQNFIPFIASASLMFVGAASAFKASLTNEVHFTAALIAALASYIWAFAYGIPAIAFATFVLSMVGVVVNKDNKLFWLEMGAFANIYVQLLPLL